MRALRIVVNTCTKLTPVEADRAIKAALDEHSAYIDIDVEDVDGDDDTEEESP